MLALGAIPLYLLARDRLVSPWAALIPALVWLLQPSVQWFAWETFHPEVIAIVPVLCAYLAAERNKIGWYWIWLALAIVWKEDLALLVHRARAAVPHPPPLASGRGDDRGRGDLVRGLRDGDGAAPRRWSDRLRAALRLAGRLARRRSREPR